MTEEKDILMIDIGMMLGNVFSMNCFCVHIKLFLPATGLILRRGEISS